MFVHFFKYQFKTLLRNRTVIFWTLVFPIILATFFNLAFSNLTSSENFDPVDVALVEKQENNSFKKILQSLNDNDDKLINLKITNLSNAKELLKDNKISGFYLIDSDIELIVNDSGINETILESIINEYLSLQSTINNIGSINPKIIYNNILNQIDLNENHFKQIDIGKNTDSTVIYFYTLIGMNCLNASFCGLRANSQIEANLSRQGIRINISPIAKYITIISSLIASFIIQFSIMMILMAYLVFGLKVNFGSQIRYIILLIAIGCFTGIALGNFTGNILKFKNEDNKISFLTCFSLVLSFFSGMMIIDVRYWIQNKLPILSYLNPVNLITDGLYALYYYDNLNRYTINMICLFLIGLLLLLVSLIIARRKQYDSI